MSLRFKFNLSLALVMSIALAVCWFELYGLLRRNALTEVQGEAGLLMQSALSIRAYTVSEVKPKLVGQLADTFLPQTVPAFAATETFNNLRSKYPEYHYKEATLNPTNLRDQAEDWEAEAVSRFIAAPDLPELSGVRNTAQGASLYVARPIRIVDPACLVCHSTPDAAPASMIRAYGGEHGFGWQQGQVIGAQIVSVPMSLPIERANQAFYSFIGLLVAVFAVMAIVLNWMLHRFVVSPILAMSEVAEGISSGKLGLEPIDDRGSDEIAKLARSFNRMTISLTKAIELLKRPGPGLR